MRNMNRRAAMVAVAAAAIVPSVALPAIAGEPELEQLWRKRAALLAEREENDAAYKRAEETLPAWARPGPSMMKKDGSYSSDEVGWPEIENPAPPTHGDVAIVRPNLYQIRDRQAANIFKQHEAVEAGQRKRVRQFIERVREQRRLKGETGLTALEDKGDKLAESFLDVDEKIIQACSPGCYIALAMVTLIEIRYEGETSQLAAHVLKTLMPALPQYLAADAEAAIRQYQSQVEA